MREYSATVGATEGNIIAVIITTHTPKNQPNEPSAVQGPLSIPRIWPPVHHQPTPATAISSATSPIRVRTAENAGLSPPAAERPAGAVALIASSGPGELGGREAALAFVLDAEGVDVGPLGLGHREIRADRMEHAVESHRLASLDTERDDVLDL